MISLATTTIARRWVTRTASSRSAGASRSVCALRSKLLIGADASPPRIFMRTATALLCLLLAACANAPAPRQRAVVPTPSDAALLDDVERRSFHFFWDLADPHTQLVPDRWPTPSFSSIAAVGFGLTAYAIGAERGYVAREAAAERTRATLQSLLSMKQGP